MGLFSKRTELSGHDEVVAARANTGEAYALAHEHRCGLDDIDHAVLIEQIGAANLCLSALVWGMHKELDDYSDADLPLAIDAIARRGRIPLDINPGGPIGHLIALLQDAIERSHRVRAQAMRFRANPRQMFAELDSSSWHLATALHVLDPHALEAVTARNVALAKVQLASAAELMDLTLGEHRAAVRERRAQ